MRRRVEELDGSGRIEMMAARYFIAFVAAPDRRDFRGNLYELAAPCGNSGHCLAAFAVGRYQRGKAAWFDRPFSETENALAEAQRRIADGSFGEFIGNFWRHRSEIRNRQPLCSRYCVSPCLFGYDVSVLKGDRHLEEDLRELLHGRETGISFYQI